MNIRIPNIIRWHPVLSLALACAVIGPCIFLYNYFNVEDRLSVSLSGVQHMGGDYLIDSFYINKYNGGNVGRGGGGGGIVCCVTLPRKWSPDLKADVRWEVHHVIRTSDPKIPDRAEVAGIYHAQVPVEAYVKPDRFWVHFFANGRVRIVISPNGPEGNEHPIQFGDMQAAQKATAGSVVDALFTAEEIAESERETARNKEKYGDWR